MESNAVLRFREEGCRDLHAARIQDISEGGFRIATNKYIKRNREYVFELILPFLYAPCMARMEARWVNSNNCGGNCAYIAGLKFRTDLPKQNQEDLLNFIRRHIVSKTPQQLMDEEEQKALLPLVVAVGPENGLETRFGNSPLLNMKFVSPEKEPNVVGVVTAEKAEAALIDTDLKTEGVLGVIENLKFSPDYDRLKLAVIADRFSPEEIDAYKNEGVRRFLLKSMSDELINQRIYG